MAKGFTEREKEVIRTKLLEKGKELFEVLGVKKTSVKELTEEVGIAQGSFYIFYNSKEELCFEIIEQEELKLKKALVEYLSSQESVTRKVFKDFLMLAFSMIDKSPLIKGLLINNEYENLVRKLPEEKIMAHIEQDQDTLAPLVKHWQEMGYMISVDPKIISGAVRALFMLTIHRREIGAGIFNDVLELWCECFAKGLIQEEGDKA